MNDHDHTACGLSRRSFLTAGTVGALGLLLGAGRALAGGGAPAVTPEEALARLKEGNKRFVADASRHPNLTRARMAETSMGGQHPFATVIACSDSRVPVEAIFDQGIGDLFVIRVAGNVADVDEVGSAEYGAGHLATPVVVVMGHTKCGAVTAVVKGDEVGGSIPKLVDNIVPAAERSKAKGLAGDALIDDAVRENVRQSLADLERQSEEIAHLVHTGKLKLAGAVYHLENGEVEWL